MKWVPDKTGRFTQRPHYDPVELDRECEDIVASFLRARYGSVDFPISTNDLVILLEREASDVDLYADFTREGDDVEGLTEFWSGGKPRVRISKELSEQPWRENRLRTTLTHELGHVKFHTFVWHLDQRQQQFDIDELKHADARCKRASIIGGPKTDWMEWQAGYTSGSFLMPLSAITKVIRSFRTSTGLVAVPSAASEQGQDLIRIVQEAFQVSADAARVRLLQLGSLGEGHAVQRTLDLP